MSKYSSSARRGGQVGHRGRVTPPAEREPAMLVVCECCGSWWVVTPGVEGSAHLLKPGELHDAGGDL
jgi:hypothetical protein